MTTTAAAHAITITIARNEVGPLVAVTVTGPRGQWRAALNPSNAHDFMASVGEAVRAQLLGVVTQHPDGWPSEHSQ